MAALAVERVVDPSADFAELVVVAVHHTVVSFDLDGSLDSVLGELEWRLVADIDH